MGEVLNLIYPNTGLMKVPVVHTPQGQWLADTTPMIDWFETRFPAGAVIPADPYQAFFSRLLEDYPDEWLWRPALYYRFGVQPDADLLSRRYAATFLSDAPLPLWLIAIQTRQRSRKAYVDGDGVSADTRAHVEGTDERAVRCGHHQRRACQNPSQSEQPAVSEQEVK